MRAIASISALPLRSLALLVALAAAALHGPAAAKAQENFASNAAVATSREAPLQAAAPGPVAPRPGAAQPGEGSPVAAIVPRERRERIAWLSAMLIALFATIASMYPVYNYVRRVWVWRREGIFNTLGARAKLEYMRLYHSYPSPRAPDEAALAAAAEAFRRFYQRWFGRDRLILPALLIAIIIFVYALLSAIFAVQTLIPSPQLTAALKIPVVAIAAITGAYILVSMDIIGRVTRRDLLPDDLHHTAIRLMACVPFGYSFASFANPSVAPFIALAATALPLSQAEEVLRRLLRRQVGQEAAPIAATDAPSQLAGVDVAVCERLSKVGVNTITQLAYSDPVLLTMRTSLGFLFVLDMVSQALAWVYLEERLNTLRPMGLRGAWELAAFARQPDEDKAALLGEIPAGLGLTPAQFDNALWQIADDDYVGFLLLAYAQEHQPGQPADAKAPPGGSAQERVSSLA